jgi:hypothetical protein
MGTVRIGDFDGRVVAGAAVFSGATVEAGRIVAG